MDRRDIASRPGIDPDALTPATGQHEPPSSTVRAAADTRAAAVRSHFFNRFPALIARAAGPDPAPPRMRPLDTVRTTIAMLSSAARTGAPREPAPSFIAKLPPELWTAVADQMDTASRKHFRISCRAAYHATTPYRLVIRSAGRLEEAAATFWPVVPRSRDSQQRPATGEPARVRRITLEDGAFDARALCTLPRSLQALSLVHVQTRIDDLYEALPRLGHLKTLRIDGDYGRRAYALTLAIAPCTALREVAFNRCGIGDFGAMKLAQNDRIRTASLFMNGITDKGAIALAAQTSLRKLALISEPITDKGAMALAQREFESLNLRNCAIGDTGARALLDRRCARRLDLSGNPLSDACRATLAEQAKAAGITLIL